MLIVKVNLDRIVVEDSEGGGVWYPSDGAEVEIENSEDVVTKTLEICQREPMRGTYIFCFVVGSRESGY